MPPQNHYAVLGVSRKADQAEIRRAFLGKVKQYHPDVNNAPGATAKMVEVNEANSVLSDPKLRAEYDRKIGVGAEPQRQRAKKRDRAQRPPASASRRARPAPAAHWVTGDSPAEAQKRKENRERIDRDIQRKRERAERERQEQREQAERERQEQLAQEQHEAAHQ